MFANYPAIPIKKMESGFGRWDSHLNPGAELLLKTHSVEMKYLLFIALLCIIPAFCNTSKPKPDLAGPSCGICQFVVSELDKFIDSQSSKQEIEAVLEKVCDVIPKSVKPVCDEFVKVCKIVFINYFKPYLFCAGVHPSFGRPFGTKGRSADDLYSYWNLPQDSPDGKWH